MTDRVTFEVTPDLWLTSNRTIANRGYLQRVRNQLHELAIWTARAQHLDRVATPVLVCWTVSYPKGVRRDKGEASNAQPTTKALLDGIVTGGWLTDDGPAYVRGEVFRRGPNLDRPSLHTIQLILTSQEVPF